MRQGHTLLELLVVLAAAGLLILIAVPPLRAWRDRAAVHRAAVEFAAFYEAARHSAILRSTGVRVQLAADTLLARFRGVRDSVFLVRPGPSRHGVSLTATRVAIDIHPNGLGRGAANGKWVLRRGVAAGSLTTSRLGRLRRWR